MGKEKLQEHRGMWLNLFKQLSRALKDIDGIKKEMGKAKKKKIARKWIDK